MEGTIIIIGFYLLAQRWILFTLENIGSRLYIAEINCEQDAFNKMRVFFIGTNILTFAKFKEWDPEMGVSNGEKYPLAKTFTLGLTVNI